MKRTLSILFVLLLIFSLTIPAFADGNPASPDSNPASASGCTCGGCSCAGCACCGCNSCQTGIAITADPSTIIQIIKHPGHSSTYTNNGTRYTSTWFSVKATGVKSYIWQIRYPGTDIWYDIPNPDVTEELTDGIILTIKLHLRSFEDILNHAGCHYRCILIDECGNSITTNDAYIYDNTPIYPEPIYPPCLPCPSFCEPHIVIAPDIPYYPPCPNPCYHAPETVVVVTTTTTTTTTVVS